MPLKVILNEPIKLFNMKIGIVIATNDAETSWNAFRFGVFSLTKKDTVKVFLLGKGVEVQDVSHEKFNVKEQMQKFADASGKIYACGTCLKVRDSEGTELCPLSTMNDLYEIVQEADKVLTF